MRKYIIVATVLIIITKTESARILAVFPTPSISHQIVFRPITQELVKLGHEVVVMTTDPAFPPGQAPENLTEIDLHNASYSTWQNDFLPAEIGKENDLIKQSRVFLNSFLIFTEKQLQIKAVQDIIRNENNKTFDLILVETCMRPALSFAHIYNAPVISITSSGPITGMYKVMGIPTHPLLYPIVPHQRLYNLTYWEKMNELYLHYYIQYIYESFQETEMKMLKKYLGPDLPPFKELYSKIDMFFQNVHPIFMDNVPVPSSVIFMGGLHQQSVKPLPKDLSTYMNSSKNGVIYVSFGTNVRTSLLSPEKIKMMMEVFSKLPYDVLWKMDTDDLPGISANVKIAKWFPQADLLRHPKIKAFVTQGGLQSTDEAITAGVPLIGIPIYGDQYFNVEKYIRHKIGIKLIWQSLTEEELRTAILTIAEDTSYRENIERYRRIINDQPQKSLERAIWWIEYLLRHGGVRHLRAPAANMTWAEYYELNLILIFLLIFIVLLTCFISFIYFILLKISAIRYVKSVKYKNS